MSEARTTGWTKGTLGEILPIKYGKSLPAKLRDSSGRFPVFGSSGRVGVHVQPLTNGPALIVGRKGTVGAVHFSTEPCWPIDTVYFSEGEQGQNLRYFKYLLDSLNLVQLDKSTAIPGLSRDDYNALNVRIAPPVEQERIVAEVEKQFSRLDEAVANLKRVKANLKRYKAAVLKAAVEGRLVPTEAELARCDGRDVEPVIPPAATIPALPSGWEWAALPRLGELNRGKSKHRPRDDIQLYGGPYPFIQTGDVRRSDGTICDFSQTYSEVGLRQSRLWPAGTLCITIAANIAETGILRTPACFPDSIVGFLSDNATTTRFIEFFIRTSREKLERFAPATAQKNINLAVLRNVLVPLPPLGEQHRIVAEVDRHLSIVREVESEVDANLKRAQVLRQAVLARAFAPPGATCAGQSEHVVATA
ncbi:MAG TPA: restriction endonuclease subunit S [Accumulibacter sp.]|nr:restriction endonuclease subunit S [Accumulibacter sp.]